MASQINNPQKQDKIKKIKASIGVFFVFVIMALFVAYVYLIIKGFLQRDAMILTFVATQIIYQIFFAKKNQTFINFFLYFECHNYFNHAVVEFEEEMQKNNSMLCVHPHGILTVGLLLNLNTYIQMPALSSRFLLSTPFLGMLCKWWGFKSVDGSNFKKLCENGQNFALVPGGFEEATLTSQKKDRVYIKHRKGFIKYGLKYGYKIYPMYSFNENKLFNTLDDTLLNFRLYLNKLKLVTAIFYSKYLFILPDPNYNLTSIVSKGIQLPKIENPTKQDVEKYHQMYINELKELFNRHKARFNNNNEMIIY
ncbi:hypothetical protein ABPG74_014640 [Tetrahymena malaccensis]